jgi:Kdo2-lipid IVA lauroyltransferase/acyltransferase
MARHRRKLPAFLHRPAYYAIRAVLATMLTGDMRANLRTARAVARVYSKFEPRRVQRTVDTLAVAFPDMPLSRRREYALRAYEHLFMLGVEMAHTPTLVTPDTWPQHIQLAGLTRAAQLLVEGRPCVMITGHCGNWELLGYTMALLGFPMHALYRPLDLKPMDQWVRQTREKRGLTLLDKYGATHVMPELMRKGELVAFIADQNAGERGLFVPFFGRLASTYKSIGLMAMQFDAPIICGQARRLVPFRDTLAPAADHEPLDITGGFSEYDPTNPLQYRVQTLDIIMPEDWKQQPDPLFYISARYRRAIERMVHAAPEQNLWLHRYWKSRPRHEQTGKPFPASLRAKLRNLPWMTDDELARIEDWSRRDAAEWAKRPPKPANIPLALTTEPLA